MKYRRLTIEQLRSFKGLEHLSDEQAQEDIIALEKLSVIMFELFQQHKAKELNPEGIKEEGEPFSERVEDKDDKPVRRKKRKLHPKKSPIVGENTPETKPNNTKQLTALALREYAGFEHLSEAEAGRLLDELKRIAQASPLVQGIPSDGQEKPTETPPGHV